MGGGSVSPGGRGGGGGGGGGGGKMQGKGGGKMGGRGGGGGGGGAGGGKMGGRPDLPPGPPPPKPEEAATNLEAYDDIPVEASGEDCPNPVEQFAELQLHPQLMHNIEVARYMRPTPVQRHAIPVGIARRDLMACAQTGSGRRPGQPRRRSQQRSQARLEVSLAQCRSESRPSPIRCCRWASLHARGRGAMWRIVAWRRGRAGTLAPPAWEELLMRKNNLGKINICA